MIKARKVIHHSTTHGKLLLVRCAIKVGGGPDKFEKAKRNTAENKYTWFPLKQKITGRNGTLHGCE